MADLEIIPLNPHSDFDRICDLYSRAADYIELETGSPPTPAYVRAALDAAPPQCGPDDRFYMGAVDGDGVLHGVGQSIRHHYEHAEWYMGLLILDPAARAQGLGRRMAQEFINLARAHAAPCIRIAVLDANAPGRKFWAKMGYRLERTVPADPKGDGHMRHVLRLNLRRE